MEEKTREEIEAMSFAEWMRYDAAMIIADQEERPRKWQDEWYRRLVDCMVEAPEQSHLGRCRMLKNHEGPHSVNQMGMHFTWEPLR